MVDAKVARGTAAPVLLSDVTDARVSDAVDHGPRIVPRAIICDDDFEILLGLRQYRGQRTAQHIGPIEDRDHD
jgi:hypothetical protein